MYTKSCKHCKGQCIKYGIRNKRQRFICNVCGKIQQAFYERKSKEQINEDTVRKLHNLGLGITGIASFMEVSKSTVQRKLETLSEKVQIPEINETDQEYEVDELKTYVGNKKKNKRWVMYAINRKTKKVLGLVVGRRTKENLKKVIDTLLLLNPRKIYTDRLNIYPGLIPKKIHRPSDKILAFIERKNLTLRTHLKRLNRKTICYSKSERMLFSSVKIYLFG